MKYDRILLLLASLAAIALSVFMVIKALGFSERFVQQRPAPDPTIEDPGIENTAKVASKLDETFVWKRPVAPPNIGVPLNKSIPIIERNGEIINMLLSDPKLRPPMTNEWLLQNKLQFRRPDVGELDPDNDGFTNEEEFAVRTDPQAADSHPPFTNKLFVYERISVPYVLKFSGVIEPQFQVQRLKPDRKTWFKSAGEKFEKIKPSDPSENRFEIKEFTRKTAPDPRTGSEKDVSELELIDHLWGDTQILVYREEKDLPTYFADFEYQLNGSERFQVEKGDTFSLSNDPETTYKLMDVTENQALIAKLNPDGSWSDSIPVRYRPAEAASEETSSEATETESSADPNAETNPTESAPTESSSTPEGENSPSVPSP